MSSRVSSSTSHEPLLASGTVLDGKYVIDQQIGAGGMGRVYVAIQKPFNRKLVVKVMHRDHTEHEILVQRFFQEAQAISRLSHPNTVTVFDFGKTDDGVLFIIMEYVQGVPLGEMIRQTGALSLEDAVSFTAQIAQALGEAHHNGIIHRDLKPDNVMVVRSSGSEPFVKVLDFGIAKMVESDKDFTQAGSIVGTPAYMAPEQARNDEVDGRTDLYALGCCLYEMLTGHRPYQKDTPVAVLLSHQNEPVPGLPRGQFPAALDEFLRSAMGKNPDKRPDDAADFIAKMMNCFMASGKKRDETLVPDRTKIDERMRILGAQTPRPSNLEQFSRNRSTNGLQNSSATAESSPSLPRPGSSSGNSRPSSSSISLPQPPQQSKTASSPIPAAVGSRNDSNPVSTTDDTPPPSPRNSSGVQQSTGNTVSSDPNAAVPEYFRENQQNQRGSNQPPSSRQRPTRQVSSQVPNSTSDRAGSPSSGTDPRHHPSPSSVSDSQSEHPSQGFEPAQSSPSNHDLSSKPTADSVSTKRPTTDGGDSSVASSTPWIVAGCTTALAVAVIGFGSMAGDDDTPDTVTVAFESNPAEATVYVDGVPIGTSPLEHEIDQQVIDEIRFEQSGHEPKRFEDFQLRQAGDNRLYAELDRRSLDLVIDSDAADAELFVDDRKLGTLGADGDNTFTLDWPAGSLEVIADHPDYGRAFRRVDARDLDDTVELSFARGHFDAPDDD